MQYYNLKNYSMNNYHINFMEVNLNPQEGLRRTTLPGIHIMHVRSYYHKKTLILKVLNMNIPSYERCTASLATKRVTFHNADEHSTLHEGKTPNAGRRLSLF